jgi:coenzyme F420-0:L-glutamate ligase / coenzyme F420-1:gamma-L-glutamate ligase
MLIVPVVTARLKQGDDVVRILGENVQDGDIVVVSSKALAMVEGQERSLDAITVTDEAKMLAKKTNQDPRFSALVLEETKRMNGDVVGTCPWALLTSLRPDGMKTGRILCPNAGLDRSNVRDDCAIGWPVDSLASVRTFRDELQKQGKHIGVILSDSCCRPGRLGVVAFALTIAGLDPIASQVGKKDLFGHELRFTHEAVADQLATAGNAVMGNANQSIPAAIIRDHGYAFSDYSGWVEGIDAHEDLFRDILK